MLALWLARRLLYSGRLGLRLLLALVHITCMSAVDTLQRTSGLQEFCQTEVFKAQCGEGEVIAMTRAMYGRMRIGRCVTTDYGHVGCDENVLVETDRRCSGRRTCEVRIPDAIFDAFKPCPIEFKTYFEAEYTCVGVAMADPRICQSSEEIAITTPAGYLSNQVAATTKVGSTNCPWRITLLPGQRINVTLIDFARPLLRPTPAQEQQQQLQHGSLCYQYALITERKATTRTTRVCGGDTRVRHVYISRTNTIEIRIIRRANRDAEEYFLIKYEAVGCSLLENQEHGWIQYDEFGAIIGCNHSEDTWRLSCRDNAWYGMRGNCTTAPPAEKLGMVVWGQLSLPYGTVLTNQYPRNPIKQYETCISDLSKYCKILRWAGGLPCCTRTDRVSIGIIVGLAIIVGVIILLVGLICLEWKKMKPEEVEEAQAAAGVAQEGAAARAIPKESIYVKQSELLPAGPHEVRVARAGPLSAQVTTAALRDNDYAYVREMWPMVPPPNHQFHAAAANADPLQYPHEQLLVSKPPWGKYPAGGAAQEAVIMLTKPSCSPQRASSPLYAGSASTSTVPTNLSNDDDEDEEDYEEEEREESEEEVDDPGDVHIYESPKALRRASRDQHYFQLDPDVSGGGGGAGGAGGGGRGGAAVKVGAGPRAAHAVYVCDTSILSPADTDTNKDNLRIF